MNCGSNPAMAAARLLSVRRWQGRILLFLVLLGPAWLLDRPLAERNPRQHKMQVVEKFRDAARQFGEPFCAMWLVLAIWFIDPSRRRPMVLTLVGVMFAGLVGNGLKLAIGRERPSVSDGHTVFRGPQWPGAMRPDPSFPSGHTVSAFALAYGMSRVLPRGRGVFVFLAAACGLSRFLGETHFLTDVLAGAWVGWESARLMWDWGVAKLIRWIDAKIPAFAWYPRWNWDLSAPA
jgi:membrane-associated phospholipid phosphatase